MKIESLDSNDNNIIQIAEDLIWTNQAKRVDIEITDENSGESYYISLIRLSISVIGRIKTKNLESNELECYEIINHEDL